MTTTTAQLATARRVTAAVSENVIARMSSRFRHADDRLSRCMSAVAAVRARDIDEPSMGFDPGGDPAERAINAAVRAHYDSHAHMLRELDARLGGRAAYVFRSLVRTEASDAEEAEAAEAEYARERAAEAAADLARMDSTFQCVACCHEQDHRDTCDACGDAVFSLTELAEAGDPAND